MNTWHGVLVVHFTMFCPKDADGSRAAAAWEAIAALMLSTVMP